MNIKDSFVKISLTDLIDRLPANVYWMDKYNVFWGCNESQAKLARLNTPSEINGKTNYDMPWKSQAAVLEANNVEVITGNCPIVREESILLDDGTEYYFLSQKLPILNEGGDITGLIGISFDITRQKQIERELRETLEREKLAIRAKNEMTHGIKQDVCLPLISLQSVSKFLAQNDNLEVVKEYANYLEKSSGSLLNFFSKILDSLERETGESINYIRPFNCRQILENVMNIYKPTALLKKLKFTLMVDDSVPRAALGEDRKIQTIVMELVSNAVKFTTEGYVNVYARILEKKERELILQIDVSDSGPGLTTQEQIDATQRRKVNNIIGAEKGLSNIKMLIDDIGAEFYVRSEIGYGTTFTVVVPIRESMMDLVVAENYVDLKSDLENNSSRFKNLEELMKSFESDAKL